MAMNQLQNLLHDSLIATGHVENCALIRRNDGSLRASSVGFVPTAIEISAFINAFKTPSETRERGIKIGDETFACFRADKFSIYAKQDSRGIILVRTSTMILVATYSAEMYPSVCVEAIEKLADYFREKGK